MEREGCSNFQLPPGFRFHPSDEELIVHYLKNKVASRPLPASIIAEIDLYKEGFVWRRNGISLLQDRKYPNGTRPNRAAGAGYWKATGTDRPILTSSGSNNIGVRKALVFYLGRPPKGTKTDWIMNEYRLLDATVKPSRLLASILAGQTLPPIETISCISNQGSNKDNSFTLVYEDGSDMLNSPITVASFDNHSSLKRKPNEEARCENLHPSNKKLDNGNRDEDLLPRHTLPNSDLNYYHQNQLQESFYTSNTFDPISGLLELNELAFSGKYLQ
ncbi:hypothetical protein GH714_002688 [Hevea brasiliensis]|uniref:NAC domain-containing protein n=1 Tax=Hevea brasiliensis TaxID=3981 RepID=A0A6A6N8S0_HEVBR|nr:hypothetical protein GH714_002688 [Hevea brasiliensis]